jgi:toxin FitB
MIILDTNVVSEAIKTGRNPTVVEWLDGQSADNLYFTATSLSELSIGLEILPTGKRKNALITGINELLAKLFGSRILPFDRDAAIAYGTVVAAARRKGKNISIPDGQIAAIATIYKFSVATRDKEPFMALGVPTINPWDERRAR